MVSKRVIHMEVTSTDADITEMDYDEIVEFTCEILELETGKYGLSYKPLPEKIK